ncbi:hypothetical protein Clacol_008790 [Clathrus columnatus]|uniref:Uncharacterized protein n=1 Tax=Clathrus columnatus TaxID=1419009 RepID=A0AAV5ANW3_9AGAM|nr:hypothetical protein Clacol_008790 [Clathrus columnatus]
MPAPQLCFDIQADSKTTSDYVSPSLFNPSISKSPSPLTTSLDVAVDVQDPFNNLSTFFIHETHDSEFWWKTTGKVFSQMMKRAFYSPDQQYKYLMFYYFTIIPELGPAPRPVIKSKSKSKRKPFIDLSSTVDRITSKPVYQSYMTDDHTPIELSWQFGGDGGVVARFAIDPVVRQSSSEDSRGAMGLFEDLSTMEVIAPGVDLDWCHKCSKILTTSNVNLDRVTSVSQYPSQYFVGFDFSLQGVVLKAYFLPETKSILTGIPKIVLVTQCVKELTRPTKNCPSPPDLITPWLNVLTFFETLPPALTPNINIVAVDCLPSKQNRVKIYCRSPLTTLSNLRRFITLGRSTAGTTNLNSPLKRGLDQITLLWYLLFPNMADSKFDNVEPLMRDPAHPTAGLLFYYELRGGHSEPFPKVYIPVRHLCRNDRHVVRALTEFYRQTGNIKAGMRYARDVQEILQVSHRRLSRRAGIHTYITVAIKESNIEVTSYFNPECYSADYHYRKESHEPSSNNFPNY